MATSIGQLNGPTINEMLDQQKAANNAPQKQEVGKEAFMQLLVAQIKHQNPLSPTDGVQFLTQLAQFSELEQLVSINTTLSGMEDSMKPADVAPDSAGSANNN